MSHLSYKFSISPIIVDVECNSPGPFPMYLVGNLGDVPQGLVYPSLVEIFPFGGIKPCRLEFKYMFNQFLLSLKIKFGFP
jgi:hypothetical protein